jgi:hypothetical protein
MPRPKADAEVQPGEVPRLRQRLDDWRKEQPPHSAFPEKRWAAAGRLAQRRGIYPMSRALGLEYSKLKRASHGVSMQAGGARKRQLARKAVRFVEVTAALPGSVGRVLLQGPDGQRLQVEMSAGAAAEVVLQLCRSGWVAA